MKLHSHLAISSTLLLRDLSTHALLHLEFQKRDNKHYRAANRNKLLLEWLKSRSKVKHYKPISKKIKSLMKETNRTGADLEQLFLQYINFHQEVSFSHLEHYLLLIREMEKKLGTTALLSQPNDVDLAHNGQNCLLCILAYDLNAHFSDSGKMLKDISILFRGLLTERHVMLGCLFSSNTFTYTVNYEDDDFIRLSLSLAE